MECGSQGHFTEISQLRDMARGPVRQADTQRGKLPMKPVNVFLKSALLLTVVIAAQGQTPPNVYLQVNIVSNVSGVAAVTDPNLVDAWGISNAGSPFWVSDHVSGLSTVYASTGVASATVVTIPAATGTGTGKPTGQVQNSAGAAFTLANGANASFIFCTEDGQIVAWNSG